MKLALLAVASIALFLVAAKVHGRSLRLEREAMGIFSVQFGGTNPPEVEKLWRDDRNRFWPLAAVLALVFGGVAFALTRGGALTAMAALSWAPSTAFFVCAALSAARAP